MKRPGIFAVLVVCFASLAAAKDKKEETLPYFFPKGAEYGVYDPLEQFTEYLREINATSLCYQPGPNVVPNISEPGSYGFVSPNLLSTSGPARKPAYSLLIFDQVVKKKKNTFLVSSLCGQHEIQEKELNFARDYVWNEMRIARGDVMVYHGPTEDFAIQRRAEQLGISEMELRSQLDKKLEKFPNVTFRESLGIPRVKSSNVVPKEMHIGSPVGIPGVLGVTWLRTGRIDLNPQWGPLDRLSGFPKIMGHEMVHVGLQKFPDSEFYDPEFEASLHEGLDSRNKIDFIFHSYLGSLREFAWVYDGLDLDAFKKEALLDFAGNLKVDVEKYYRTLAKVEVLKGRFAPAIQRASGEFRSNELFWFALNQRLGNKNSVYYVTMACEFTPSIGGGTNWLTAHEEEIKRIGIASEAMSGMFFGFRVQEIVTAIVQGRPGDFLKIHDTKDAFLSFDEPSIAQFKRAAGESKQGAADEPPSQKTIFILQAALKGWTPEQIAAAYYWWLRLEYTSTKSGKCVPDYSRVSNQEMAAIAEAKASILTQLLADKGEWKLFIDATGLRGDLEHEAEITKAQHALLAEDPATGNGKTANSGFHGPALRKR